MRRNFEGFERWGEERGKMREKFESMQEKEMGQENERQKDGEKII